MRPLFVMFVTLASCAVQAVEVKAVKCGNVFDSKGAKLIGAHTIRIEDDAISAIVPGFVEFKDAKPIDLAEFTCLPGFIDLHVHLSGESNKDRYTEQFRLNDADFILRSVAFAERTLLAGFTAVRDLGGENAKPLRDAINQGLIKGPRIFAAIKSIASTGGHADSSNGLNEKFSQLIGEMGPEQGIVNSVDDARKAVRKAYKNGSDVIKITATGGVLSYAKSADAPQFTQDEIAAIVATANDYGLKVAAHAHGKEGVKRAILGGVTSIEHGSFMDEELFALMKKRGTWYIPTLSAGKFTAEKAKVEGFYPEIIRPKAIRVAAQMQETFRKAYKAGLKIAFGTDSGVSLHGENAAEFLLMTQEGMPAAIALQSATYSAAQVLGEDKLGELASGMKADIIAVRGDPTKDIALTKKIDFVMKNGVVYASPR